MERERERERERRVKRPERLMCVYMHLNCQLSSLLHFVGSSVHSQNICGIQAVHVCMHMRSGGNKKYYAVAFLSL